MVTCACSFRQCISALAVLIILLASQVAAIHITVFEQADRTAPVPQALIYADGEYMAATDVNGTYNLFSEGEPPRIRIVKAGYREWIGTPARNDTLLLIPLQIRNTTSSVQVFDADTLLPVEGAQVKIALGDMVIEQNRTGPDGTVLLPVRAEQVYDLTITSRNYLPFREKLITGFENNEVQYSLVRNDRISLQVKDARDGRLIADAAISINNLTAGKTTENGIFITNLTRGMNYTISAGVAGYEKTVRQITPGIDDQIIDLTMNREKSPAFISVYDPERRPVEGVDISIDRNGTGSTNQYGRLTVPNLEAGEYLIGIAKGGYESQSRSVSFTPSEPDITFDIRPEPVLIPAKVQDPGGLPLINATVRVNDAENRTTDENGTVMLTLEQGHSYLIAASMPGYYPNNTSAAVPVSSPVIVILHPEEPKTITPTSDLLLYIIALVAGVGIGAAYLLLRGKKRSRSQKKRLSLRKRSL